MSDNRIKSSVEHALVPPFRYEHGYILDCASYAKTSHTYRDLTYVKYGRMYTLLETPKDDDATWQSLNQIVADALNVYCDTTELDNVTLRAMSVFKLPFKAGALGLSVQDDNGNLVCDNKTSCHPYRFNHKEPDMADVDPYQTVQRIRGWGLFCKLADGAVLQDAVGQLVANALNVYFTKQDSYIKQVAGMLYTLMRDGSNVAVYSDGFEFYAGDALGYAALKHNISQATGEFIANVIQQDYGVQTTFKDNWFAMEWRSA